MLGGSCDDPPEIGVIAPLCQPEEEARLRSIAAESVAVDCGLPAIIDAWSKGGHTNPKEVCGCVAALGFDRFRPFRCRLHDSSSEFESASPISTFAGYCGAPSCGH